MNFEAAAVVWRAERDQFYEECRRQNAARCAEAGHHAFGTVHEQTCVVCGWNLRCAVEGHVWSEPRGEHPFRYRVCRTCGQMM